MKNGVTRRNLLILSSSALALPLMPRALYARSHYPARPIRLIVPFPPGGVVDFVGRIWAATMTSLLGTIIVENRGGASGSIGAEYVANAAPDGYTLLVGNTSTQLLDPALTPNLPYTMKNFATVGIISNSAVAVCVNPSIPARTVAQLVAYIKAHPGKMFFGTAGTGTISHLAGEMFKQRAGTPHIFHVPYKGGGPAIEATLGNQIPMMFVNVTASLLALNKAGKIRIVGVLSPKRLSVLPDVQAASETYPGLVMELTTAVFAPAGTPKPILNRIAQAHEAAMKNGALEKKLSAAGLEPVHDTPEEAQHYFDAERGRLLPLIKSLHFKKG